MADASVLGIHPPSTVRISWEGWERDWPFESVAILGDRVVIKGITARIDYSNDRVEVVAEEPAVLYFPYEHARPCCTAHATGRFFPPPHQHPPAWIFHGGSTHRDFTITAGPPQAPSPN